ncbi:FAD-binding oxidoreductase [Streptomyces fagopyri]|uniref:FAD-binding oxidoreductase n=1 Tax=Streptomyces fagopyri TaxID=2662397 RepID=UPI0037120951
MATVPPLADIRGDAPPPGLAHALEAVRAVIGSRGSVDPGETGGNVSFFRPRIVHAVVRPTRVDQVRRVVALFDDPAVGCGLHPISTGRNWGLGSREPARDHVVTLDLAGLDRVREVNTEHGWAVVEPGVTQGRLAGCLTGTGRMLNVTAASAHTSVVGNLLDRGVGVRRQRTEDLAGLEVVLPDGELVHVGWWPEEGRATAVYPPGLGPCPLQLFTQSDLGVITAAAVRLLPRPEAQRLIRLSFPRSGLTDAVEALRRFAAQGLVDGVIKVYDLVSAQFYGGRAGEFLAHVCVSGTAGSAEALAGIVIGEATACGVFTEVVLSREPGGEPGDAVVNMLEGTHRGDVGHNDAMLEATLGQSAEHVDALGEGWLFFMPMVPFTGTAVSTAYGLLDRLHAETGRRPGCTVNGLGPDLVDFVVTFRFPRDAEAAEAAHRALDRAHELFAAHGFIPYRLDIDHADWIGRLDPSPAARDLTRRMKHWLDPHGAIAPGRYS